MKARLAKLIDVKSIMTLLLTIVFCVLACTGVISGADFLTVFTVVVAFYFGTQSRKNATVASYTGPQQGQTKDDTVMLDAGHPPDVQPTAQIGFER